MAEPQPASTSSPPRRRFTVADVLAMQAAGVLAPKGHELMDGDIHVMAAKKNDHEITKNGLMRRLARLLPDSLTLAVESTLFLSDVSAPEPDLMIYPSSLKPEDVRGGDVLLLIEVADETLARDLGRKASLYAEAGVQEYWVIEAPIRRAHVHLGPMANAVWRERRIVDAGAPLAPAFDAALVLNLANL